ncbi:MAG: hypothetical protein IKA05_04315 [Clostridia bacterium]|nr:hypothetical protein [Clostridia bacterium]
MGKSYYVVQAIPNTKAKTLFVVTAFIGKKGYKKRTSQLIDGEASNATVKPGSVMVPKNSIPEKSENVNRKSEKILNVPKPRTPDGMLIVFDKIYSK